MVLPNLREAKHAEDLDADQLRDLLLLWQEAKSNAIGPPDLDFLDFPEQAAYSIKFSIGPDNDLSTATVVFAGTGAVHEMQQDPTGKQVRDLPQYSNGQIMIRNCFTKQKPLRSGPHQVAFEPKKFRLTEFLYLPLSRDGSRVDAILLAVHYLDAGGN